MKAYPPLWNSTNMQNPYVWIHHFILPLLEIALKIAFPLKVYHKQSISTKKNILNVTTSQIDATANTKEYLTLFFL